MRSVLPRPSLARSVQVALAGTILVFSLGSSSVSALEEVGRPLRWAALVALLALALAYAVSARGRPPSAVFVLPVAAFAGLALVSALWSVDPWLTAGRAVSLGILFAVAGALAAATAGRPDGIASLLIGVLAGAALVALGGLLVLAVDPGDAVQRALPGSPARLRGLGQNPNWASMLAALALPLAAWRAREVRGRRARVLALGVVLMLGGTIVAADSRSALIAGVAGLLVLFGVMSGTLRRGLALALVAAALVAGGVVFGQARTSPAPLVGTPGGKDRLNPDIVLPLGSEIGRVPPGHRDPGGRSLRRGSGRWQAWGGAIDEGNKRPLLGYGFGTEDRVFIDRYFFFNANLVENAYIGLYLQLGLAGLALLLAMVVPALRSAARALERPPGRERRLVAACLATLVTGLLLGVGQSFLFSVGSIATLSFWTCAFLAAALETLPAGRRRRETEPRPERGRAESLVPS